MLELDPGSLLYTISTGAVAIVLLIIFAQRVLKDWKSTSVETSVISLMHSELERLSKQNSELSIEIGRLHSEIINLNTQLQQLTIDNQALQVEVVTLTNELTRFHLVLQKGELDGIAN